MAECDKSNPNSASITWSGEVAYSSITTNASCSNGEISGGVATLNSKIGNCTAIMGQTGIEFAGEDC